VAAADAYGGLSYTVVRTPPSERVALPPIERGRNVIFGRVRPFPDRAIPPVFWYDNGGVRYGVLHHKERAPLVVLIAGTGASFNSSTNRIIAQALYGAGMHVLGLPSPTHPNFIINGSASMVPGRPEDDARDLYRVMQLALAQLEGKIDVSSIHLAGYSLGALHAAWVAQLDARERALGFTKVLLLNPPVSLWNSVEILDGMYDRHVPDDPAAAEEVIDRVFARFAEVYTRESDVNFDGDFLYAAHRALEPSQAALELLVGTSFRLSSSNLLFTSDVMSRSGYMVSRDAPLENTTSLTNFYKHAMRQSFNDYIDGVYMPYYQRQNPSYTKAEAIEEAALTPLEAFLRENPDIGVITNQDDIILAPGELDWLKSVFGERAAVLPDGGHSGNYERRDFVDALRHFFVR
jgi:pimeloyl-ACP methyl ester carboxylesterase